MSGVIVSDWVAVIDDHDSLRSSLQRALRLEGIRSEGFASAERYLARGGTTDPCCLLLDMQLPGMSGFELARYLDSQLPPRPPTIFISAHDDALASVATGIASHGRLSKPFDIEVLLALVQPIVEAAGAVSSVPQDAR